MEEIIKILFENDKIKVEEICSCGAVSPQNFWYDNPIDEFVVIKAGSAILQFTDKEISLNTGDYYYIKAHEKHRVNYTSNDCIWLCVYVKIK